VVLDYCGVKRVEPEEGGEQRGKSEAEYIEPDTGEAAIPVRGQQEEGWPQKQRRVRGIRNLIFFVLQSPAKLAPLGLDFLICC
jgi:hypothetical protein